SFFPRRLRRLLAPASLQKKLPARVLRSRCGPLGSGGPDAPITVSHRREMVPGRQAKETLK
ncbi:hypothetical protein, partial [Mesorhizobium sp.]|uniref:hypothetical protein n=1 Tax=Mesorhizobium sp. TaxID=1871066 RepID=UPI0025CF7508